MKTSGYRRKILKHQLVASLDIFLFGYIGIKLVET
jgi:hypothetical protein